MSGGRRFHLRGLCFRIAGTKKSCGVRVNAARIWCQCRYMIITAVDLDPRDKLTDSLLWLFEVLKMKI